MSRIRCSVDYSLCANLRRETVKCILQTGAYFCDRETGILSSESLWVSHGEEGDCIHGDGNPWDQDGEKGPSVETTDSDGEDEQEREASSSA